MKENKQAIKLLLLAVFAEIVVLSNGLAYWIGNLLSDDITMIGIVTYLLSYLSYGVGIVLICTVYKKNTDMHFENKEKPTSTHLIIGLIFFALAIIINIISWDGLQVYKELFGSIRLLGTGFGIANFIAQYIYYFLEVILMVIMLACAQQSGELFFKKTTIPYGGIFLALAWGLDHISNHGLVDGLITTLSALIYGIVFLFMRNNIKYAFWLVLIMFTL